MENNKGIKIVFSGASSVGKSTLINVLREEFRDFTVQTESVRYLKNKYGMDFRSGDTALQMALLTMQTNLLISPGNFFLDRSLDNSFAYCSYYRDRNQSDIPESAFRFIEDVSKEYAQKYIDLIIFLRPEFPVVEDGVRITDDDYRRDTDLAIEKTIIDWGLEDRTITPHGSVIERAMYCKPFIEKLIKGEPLGLNNF